MILRSVAARYKRKAGVAMPSMCLWMIRGLAPSDGQHVFMVFMVFMVLPLRRVVVLGQWQ